MKKDIQKKLEKQLRSKLLELPDYAADFITSLENTRELRTRIEYSRDIISFLEFLQHSKGKSDITLKDLDSLLRSDFSNYLSHLSEYEKTFETSAGKVVTQTFQNGDSGKSRKMASLHEFFQFLFNEGSLSKNVSSRVSVYVRRKAKIKDMLTPDELKYLFRVIIDEENIPTERERAFAKRLKYRDYAIVSLLAYSGIRVGELVQLDLDNISIDYGAIVVTRKGGNEERVPLPQEVILDMNDFLMQRKKVETKETALFLSQQNKRINARTVNNMLGKYGERCGFEFKLTPHVFRRTFGTTHYNRYGDISMTGKLLGHKSTETTRKFYAAIADERVNESMKKFSYGIEENDGAESRVKEMMKTTGLSKDELLKALVENSYTQK